MAKNEARLSPKVRLTKAELKAKRQEQIKKAQEARRLKVTEREIVRQKVLSNLPITEEEREKLQWSSAPKVDREVKEKLTIAAAAKLVIKPQSVAELRLLVEKTAAKHHYNPIEALILQTRSNEIPEKEKVAIHKALLPYLAPQMPTPKADAVTGSSGVKVVISSFTFPADSQKTGPLHAERPKTVEIEAEDAAP